MRHLCRFTDAPIELRAAGGVESDHETRVVVPPVEEERHAADVAAFRALLELAGQGRPAWKPWWKALYSRKTK